MITPAGNHFLMELELDNKGLESVLAVTGQALGRRESASASNAAEENVFETAEFGNAPEASSRCENIKVLSDSNNQSS